jgi:regulator of protease activity HflC (stomatin/prohibitin superfamily)
LNHIRLWRCRISFIISRYSNCKHLIGCGRRNWLLLYFVKGVFILPGFVVVNPNESKVLTFFGKYVGSVKQDGFFWVNPFTVKKKVSLRAFNLNGQQLKVNDSVGNPIEIAAVIVWQIKNTASAVLLSRITCNM